MSKVIYLLNVRTIWWYGGEKNISQPHIYPLWKINNSHSVTMQCSMLINIFHIIKQHNNINHHKSKKKQWIGSSKTSILKDEAKLRQLCTSPTLDLLVRREWKNYFQFICCEESWPNMDYNKCKINLINLLNKYIWF